MSQQQINLYFLNSSNIINELISDASSPPTWSPGSLDDHQIQAPDDSSFAAVAHAHPGCFTCDNATIFAYTEASDRKINVGRGNSSHWTTTTLPVSGDGISMTLRWEANQTTTGIRIFYQDSEGTYDYAYDVEEENADPNFADWKPLGSFPSLVGSSNGSIASLAYGTDPSSSPINIEVLSSGSHGVTNIPWLNSAGWENNTEPMAMEGLDAYTPLAANSDGRIYGIQNGLIKEYQLSTDGESSWTLVGDVVT